jgi:hypothetical protein
VERYRRQTAGEPGSWLLTAVTDPAGMVEFESLGIAVPVAEIYAGVSRTPLLASEAGKLTGSPGNSSVHQSKSTDCRWPRWIATAVPPMR